MLKTNSIALLKSIAMGALLTSGATAEGKSKHSEESDKPLYNSKLSRSVISSESLAEIKRKGDDDGNDGDDDAAVRLAKLLDAVDAINERRRELLRKPRVIDLSLTPVETVLSFLSKAYDHSVKVRLNILNVTPKDLERILNDPNARQIEEEKFNWTYQPLPISFNVKKFEDPTEDLSQKKDRKGEDMKGEEDKKEGAKKKTEENPPNSPNVKKDGAEEKAEDLLRDPENNSANDSASDKKDEGAEKSDHAKYDDADAKTGADAKTAKPKGRFPDPQGNKGNKGNIRSNGLRSLPAQRAAARGLRTPDLEDLRGKPPLKGAPLVSPNRPTEDLAPKDALDLTLLSWKGTTTKYIKNLNPPEINLYTHAKHPTHNLVKIFCRKNANIAQKEGEIIEFGG